MYDQETCLYNFRENSKKEKKSIIQYNPTTIYVAIHFQIIIGGKRRR